MNLSISNRRILNDIDKLSVLSQKELPVKVSYAIYKNINKIESELKIYNKEREKLIEKYSIKDEEGKTIVDDNNQMHIQPDKQQDWNREINELMDIENEVDIHKFRIEELNGYNMSVADLRAIDYMIEE